MKRLPVESKEIPCRVKKPRRWAGIRTKQGISELAESKGFEPLWRCRLTVFKTAPL